MVTARIDLQGLSNELNSFRQSFDAWATSSVANAEAEKDKHFRQLREFQSVIRSLQQQQRDLEKKAIEVQQRLRDEAEEVSELEAELVKIRAEQEALPALLAEVQAALDAETASAQQEASELAAKEASQGKVLSGVRRALDMYEQRLGLAFVHKPMDDALDVVFTQLDPADPQREFKLGVLVLEDDRYEVRSCTPELADLQELLDSLNATNDFSGFVKAARAAFKATLTTTA